MSFEGLKKNNSRSFIYGRSSTKPAKFEHGLPIGLAPFFLLLILATSVDHCMHLSFMFTYLFYLLTDLRDIVNTIRNFGRSVCGSSDTAFRYRYFNNFSPTGERSIVMSLSVCLSVCAFVCPRSYLGNYTSCLQKNVVHVTTAVARSSGSVVIRHVLPVLWMTSYLLISPCCSTSPHS